MRRASFCGGARTGAEMAAEPLGKEHKAACAQPGFREAKDRPASHSSVGRIEAIPFLVCDRITRDGRRKGREGQAGDRARITSLQDAAGKSAQSWGSGLMAGVTLRTPPSHSGHDATGPGVHREQPGATGQAELLSQMSPEQEAVK